MLDSPPWVVSCGLLAAHGYYLIAGSQYAEKPTPDDNLSTGITDAGRISLVQSPDPINVAVIDALCYAYDAASLALVELLTCSGTPADNPHDDTTASDADRSLARTPRDCTETGDDSMDFGPREPATPKSSASPKTVY
jgi:hypothetical protein